MNRTKMPNLITKIAITLAFVASAFIFSNSTANADSSEPSAGNGSLCDRLAAHPNDPDKPSNVQGVSDESLAVNPDKAASACSDALQAEPNIARYSFQLGRALASGNELEDAVHFFKQAADQGSAAAKTYLAALYEEGLGVKKDHSKALKLLAEAEKGGFTFFEHSSQNTQQESPTQIAAREIIDEKSMPRSTTISNTAQAIEEFRRQKMTAPEIIGPLYTGDFGAIQQNPWLVVVYIYGMNEFVKQDVNLTDPSCPFLDMADPQFELRLEWIWFTVMTKGFSSGENTFIEGLTTAPAIKKAGHRDMMRLAQKYSCEDEGVERIYKNAIAFADKAYAEAKSGLGSKKTTHTTKTISLYEGKIQDFRAVWFDMDESSAAKNQLQQIESADQKILHCTYGPMDPDGEHGFQTYKFWYRSAPLPQSELLVGPRNALRNFGNSAMQACPPNLGEARRIQLSGGS